VGRCNFFHLDLDLAEEVHADSLVDFRFRREEADIGRRQVQLAYNIGDGRLLKSDLPEQAFRYLDTQLMSVFFFEFFLRPHIPTILPNISVTMVVARALRFPQMEACIILLTPVARQSDAADQLWQRGLHLIK
jgi:hypothetical protein